MNKHANLPFFGRFFCVNYLFSNFYKNGVYKYKVIGYTYLYK